MADEVLSFRAAVPVWPVGREREMNSFVGFRAHFFAKASDPVQLRITACSLYRVYLNGEFLFHGPAITAHGFARVDELDLSSRLQEGMNLIAVEVAGYNVNSYYIPNQTSFLQAEIVNGERVLAATDEQGISFISLNLPERVRKVQRYSFQRTFSEVYRLDSSSYAWRRDINAQIATVPLSVQRGLKLLSRHIRYPDFKLHSSRAIVSRGRMEPIPPSAKPYRDWSMTAIGPQQLGFKEAELELIPSLEIQNYKSVLTEVAEPYDAEAALSLDKGDCFIADFGQNLTGFPSAIITCAAACHLILTFDELLTNHDVNWMRLGGVNILPFYLQPGEYRLESFEPYTLRCLKVASLDGQCKVSGIRLRSYANPAGAEVQFTSSDPRLDRIFAAAVETFRQNSVDLFTDCPSRERAGWLCDSFFTARVAFDLTGDTRDERNFLENFLLPETFQYLPPGMLPMCYPADHPNGIFIPQWAMWFVLQLEEYFHRSADRELVDALHPRISQLLKYLDTFINADGLLENLPSWKFIEWSKANDFVDGVNYPTNMLYATVLDAVGRLYSDQSLHDRAARMRETVLSQSFDGQFFVDQAKHENTKLVRTTNRTEVCQYFAFFFNVATPESHPQLWKTLCEDFGPNRKQTKKFPEIYPANAFVGNYLRLDLLARHGKRQQLATEIVGYFDKMATATGTLWENDEPSASCDHGFASHVARWLLRELMGVTVDGGNVKLRLANVGLDHCETTLTLSGGRTVHLRWQRDAHAISYEAILPPGMQLQLDNQTDLPATRQSNG